MRRKDKFGLLLAFMNGAYSAYVLHNAGKHARMITYLETSFLSLERKGPGHAGATGQAIMLFERVSERDSCTPHVKSREDGGMNVAISGVLHPLAPDVEMVLNEIIQTKADGQIRAGIGLLQCDELLIVSS